MSSHLVSLAASVQYEWCSRFSPLFWEISQNPLNLLYYRHCCFYHNNNNNTSNNIMIIIISNGLVFVVQSRSDWFACMFWALILHYCALKLKLWKRWIVVQESRTIKSTSYYMYYITSPSFALRLARSLALACVRTGSRKWSENEIELHPQINESVKKIDSEMYQIGFAISSATIAFKVAADAVWPAFAPPSSLTLCTQTDSFRIDAAAAHQIFVHNVFIWFDFGISASHNNSSSSSNINLWANMLFTWARCIE